MNKVINIITVNFVTIRQMHIVESKKGVDVRAPRRFLHKGAAHSEPELGVHYESPRAFEQVRAPGGSGSVKIKLKCLIEN